MSDYRRLISYMYSYNGDIKNKNLGFAKTELKNDRVRVRLGMKGVLSNEKNWILNFFTRHNGEINTVKLGEVTMSNGAIETDMTKPYPELGVSFDDICGIYMSGGDFVIASQWDDVPFEPSGLTSESQNSIQSAVTAEVPVWERPIKQEVYIPAENDQMILTMEEEPSIEDAPKTTWDSLFEEREQVLVFADDDIYDCVDITPEDIIKLPEGAKPLMTNSFVNHGFFNFHHLLLARKNGGGLVVGVPGIYNRREKMTAEMFGFDYFKFSMRSDVRMNHFGYWYKIISDFIA